MIQLAILLACTVALEAARYGDYSGAQMPHFGISYENKEPGSNEYTDRAPDSAASFDYKYEEEPKNNIDTPEQDDENAWQIRSKKRSKLTEDRETVYADEDETVPRFKSKRRFQKHRPRIKVSHKDSIRKSIDYDETPNEDIDVLDNNGYMNKHRSRDDNQLDLENFYFRYTTRKIARRKPRDRIISREKSHEYNIQDDEIDLKGKESDAKEPEKDYQRGDHRKTTLKRTRTSYLDLEKIKNENYLEYEDTIRFNTIRNRLPELFRQTKALETSEMTPSTRLLQDITYRRVNLLQKLSEATSATEASSVATTTDNVVTLPLTRQIKEINKKSTPSNSSELSLAEKSRLSILKKSQKKVGLYNVNMTTKPPVLMQVTKQMQTVVMIESPNRDVHLRAREIFDDSPERLNRAKKLMRHKLVAGARSVHDLIENWDEIVCDYIDTSLLNNGCYHHMRIDFKIILLSVINYLFSKAFV